MKFAAAAAVLLSGLVAANPLPQPSTMLGHMIMRRDTVDYAEFVPEPCKELCRVNNGLYTEWEAKNCNKEVTDDCNKTMCKYVDSQLECAECQLRNSDDKNVVSENDIDQSKDEARRQCQQLGYPTKL